MPDVSFFKEHVADFQVPKFKITKTFFYATYRGI